MSTIGERIKAIRLYNELSQENFGKRLGLSHAHISKIENGKEKPSNTLVRLIMYEFKISYDYLYEGKGSMHVQLPDFLEKICEEDSTLMQSRIANVLDAFKEKYVNSDDLKYQVYNVLIFLEATFNSFTKYGDNRSLSRVLCYNLMDIICKVDSLISCPEQYHQGEKYFNRSYLSSVYIESMEQIILRFKEIYDIMNDQQDFYNEN